MLDERLINTLLQEATLQDGGMVTYNLNNPDEKSLVSSNIAKQLDRRAKQAYYNHLNKPDPFIEQTRLINTLLQAEDMDIKTLSQRIYGC